VALCNTSARIGPPEVWDKRIEAVRAGGMTVIVGGVIERWFTPAFRERAPAEVERIAAMLRGMPPAGYIAACTAIREMDQRAQLGSIGVRTLVIAGAADQATPAADGKWAAEQIPGARYVELAAAHLSNIEAADAFTAALVDFLTVTG
jgi:3-oxoadipate enol-lactonase